MIDGGVVLSGSSSSSPEIGSSGKGREKRMAVVNWSFEGDGVVEKERVRWVVGKMRWFPARVGFLKGRERGLVGRRDIFLDFQVKLNGPKKYRLSLYI